MKPIPNPAPNRPPPPASNPTMLLDHAPPLLSVPSSHIRGGSFHEMLLQLGHHLEDLGSILLEHSVGKDASLDSVITASPSCCSTGCVPRRKDGIAKAARARPDVRSALSGGSMQPKVLEAVQREIQSHLLTVKEQERNEKLWELTRGAKNLPPPLSPWLCDPAISKHDRAKKNGSRSSQCMDLAATRTGTTRFAFDEDSHCEAAGNGHELEHGKSQDGAVFPKSLAAKNLEARSKASCSKADLQHQQSLAMLRSIAKEASMPTRKSQHKKLLIGNARSKQQDERQQEREMAIENMLSRPNEDAQPGFSKQDMIVAVVILANALVMGISADIEWQLGWDIMEYLFTAFFLGEMLFKIKDLGLKGYFIGPDWHWNIFDFVVVMIALVDLGIGVVIKAAQAGDSVDLSKFTAVKLARLGRLGRLIRLLRFKMFKELKAMVTGVFAGLHVLMWAIVLFFGFIFALAMVLRNVYMDDEFPYMKEAFGTTPWAMFTLFRCFTDGCSAHDGTPLIVHFYAKYGAYFMIFYMLVFLFVTIGLFNLIMAIFVDNVMESTRHMKKVQREANHQIMEGRLREVVMKAVKHRWKRLNKKRKLGLTRVESREKSMSKQLSQEEKTKAYLIKFVPDTRPGLQWYVVKLELCFKRICCCKKREPEEEEVTDEDIADMPRDENDNLLIDRELFNMLIEDPTMDEMMEQLDISTSNRWELFDVLDADMSGQLCLEELIVGFMNMRGPTEKSDIVAALLVARNTMQMVQELQEDHETFAQEAMSELLGILSAVQILARVMLPVGDEGLDDLDQQVTQVTARVSQHFRRSQLKKGTMTCDFDETPSVTANSF